MTTVLDEPCFSATITGERVDTRGEARFFRGHTIAASAGTTPDGIFAAWSWDGRRLTARTDRYGASPLFYAVSSRGITISPSLVRVVDSGAPTEFDDAAMALFLRLGFFVGDDTPFQSIHVLPPDGVLVWEAGDLSVTGGYRLVPEQRINRGGAIDGFIELHRQAMRRRPPAEHDVVMPLSSGRDSRHILLELCASGHRPDYAVTISRFPPRSTEDERVAPILAEALDVPHRLLTQTASRFEPEQRKNWGTHLCADEHGWYLPMIDALGGNVGTIYDGLGGGLSVPNRFVSREAFALFDGGRLQELAARLLLSLSRSGESFLTAIVKPRYRQTWSFEVAVDRFARELARHAAAADPIKSFNFWNRIRRELALTPYALMRHVPTVYSPYLDHDVYDFLSSLPVTVLSPTLTPSDKSFHNDAIRRGYPEFAHIPFEDSKAPKRDASAIDGRFAADVARYLLPHAAMPTRALNRSYLWPRLMYTLTRRHYGEQTPWLASTGLYLFQLEALAQRRHRTLIENPRVVTPHVVGGARRAEIMNVDHLPIPGIVSMPRPQAQIDVGDVR